MFALQISKMANKSSLNSNTYSENEKIHEIKEEFIEIIDNDISVEESKILKTQIKQDQENGVITNIVSNQTVANFEPSKKRNRKQNLKAKIMSHEIDKTDSKDSKEISKFQTPRMLEMKCQYCFKHFEKHIELYKHIQNLHRAECKYCQKNFQGMDSLQNHIDIFHKPKEKLENEISFDENTSPLNTGSTR